MSAPVTSCACWSCNSLCGGDTDAASCGPARVTEWGPVCSACLAKADVFDRDRTGAAVRATGGDIKLSVDVFDTYRAAHIFLTPAGARTLAVRLMALAADEEQSSQ